MAKITDIHGIFKTYFQMISNGCRENISSIYGPIYNQPIKIPTWQVITVIDLTNIYTANIFLISRLI